MKTKIGIPIGLALVMFLGVFTAMLAFGTLSPQPTQAQTTTPSADQVHLPNVGGTWRDGDGDHRNQ